MGEMDMHQFLRILLVDFFFGLILQKTGGIDKNSTGSIRILKLKSKEAL